MMPTIYDLLYTVASPALLSLLGYRYAFRRKYRESIAGMLGRRMPKPVPPSRDGRRPRVFWVHSVSVGEVVAANGVIREMRAAWPDSRIYASTITETGQAHARRLLAELVDEIFYYPLDLSWIVRRFLDHIRPDVYVMMETELWPNLLLQCRRMGIPVVMMNGKLSERSYRLYHQFRFLFHPVLNGIDAFCMQTRLDAARMKDLCGHGPRVYVTGNCKFDAVPTPQDLSERRALAMRWGLDLSRPIVVVGSTHPGEEEIVAQAAVALKSEAPGLTWIVAPRHIERRDQVCAVFANRGLSVSSVSNLSTPNPDVLVLDVMGELAHAYGLGTIGVVCGSFVPIGGHNLLEPAVYGIPVLYGPHMEKQPELLRFFTESGGGVQVEPGELEPMIGRLLQDPDERQRLGKLAAEMIELNRGSAQRHMQVLRRVLESREGKRKK